MNPENALLSRRVWTIDNGRVVLEERWNLRHPDCPFFVLNPLEGTDIAVRQRVMSREELDELKPVLR